MTLDGSGEEVIAFSIVLPYDEQLLAFARSLGGRAWHLFRHANWLQSDIKMMERHFAGECVGMYHDNNGKHIGPRPA